MNRQNIAYEEKNVNSNAENQNINEQSNDYIEGALDVDDFLKCYRDKQMIFFKSTCRQEQNRKNAMQNCFTLKRNSNLTLS